MDTSIIPERKDIPEEFTWDLRDIFPDDAAWGQELEKLGAMGREGLHALFCSDAASGYRDRVRKDA